MKTVFVALLMIGIAMGQTPAKLLVDQSKYKCPVGQEADWNYYREACAAGEMCTVQVNCYPKPTKPSAKKVAWSALSQGKPVIKMCSGLTGECDPTALDGLNTFNACRDQKWIGMAKWKGTDVRCADLKDAVKASDLADMIPDTPPLDVPAIRKTRSQSVCIGAHGGGSGSDARWECDQWKVKQLSHWTCPDPDAYSLQISVSGKKANCHRIVP